MLTPYARSTGVPGASVNRARLLVAFRPQIVDNRGQSELRNLEKRGAPPRRDKLTDNSREELMSENCVTVPKSIERIIQRGISELNPARILVFGSRARGDAGAHSDFDLAFQGVSDNASWHRFAAEMALDAPTLHGLDVVRYEAAPPELRASIDREGVVLYEAG